MSQGHSTLVMAALNGRLQDYLSAGDRARTTAALAHLINLIPDGDHRTAVGGKA